MTYFDDLGNSTKDYRTLYRTTTQVSRQPDEKDREKALGYATAFLLRTTPIVSMTIVSTQNINDISLSAFGHVRDVSGRMSKVQILQGTLTSKCRSLVTWPTKTPAGIHLNIALPPRDTACWPWVS
jgi:hypothetical protein